MNLKRLKRMRYMMGCFVSIEVDVANENLGDLAIEDAFAEMKRLESLLSKFQKDSIVAKINRCASSVPVKVSQEVFELLVKAVEFSELTMGAFDITVDPLTKLWRTAQTRNALPTNAEILEEHAKVDYRRIRLNRSRLEVFFEKPGMSIDLGAIGKGYAVDKAIQVLKNYNIEHAIVSTGSTIYHLGSNTETFGITDPLDNEIMMGELKLQCNAVSTSANYERGFQVQEKEVGHLINPKTGDVSRGEFLSVSVIHPSAMVSDILSTSIFLLGKNIADSLMYFFKQSVAICMTRQEEILRLNAA